MKITIKALSLLMLVSLVATLAFAQAEAGFISGTVRDSSGAVVAGASVSVKDVSTGAERPPVQTGNIGQYTVPGLVPGVYEVTVTSGSFAPFRARAEVTVGGHATVDATLSVSKQSTIVEVTEAAAGTEVNTETQELSQVITPQQVAQLPSLTRNPYDFVILSGNVSNGDRSSTSSSTGGDQTSTNYGVNFNVNGQRSSGTEILLDGAENIDWFDDAVAQQVPLDAVQEYRVVTSNFDAQYGRASGGVVNVTTKTGSNSFHGSVWEYNRLSDYTANTYTNDALGVPKGIYTRNQFGYTIGGPIWKDKLFFFQSTEWLRVRSAASLTAYVPTPQFLALTAPNVQQFFKAYGNNSFNFTSTLSAAQVMQSAGVSPTGPFATTVPAATPVLGLVNFSAPANAGGENPQNTYDIFGRLDFNMTDKTQMFFRYGLFSEDQFNGSQFASPYSQYDVGQTWYNNTALYSLNHTWSPDLFTNTKASFSRVNTVQTYNPSSVSVPELLLSTGPTVAGQPVGMPGLWALEPGAGGEPYGGPQNLLQLGHDISWVKGTHTLRLGGEYSYLQINRAYGIYNQAYEILGTSNATGFDAMMTGDLSLFQAAVNPQGKFPCSVDPATGTLIQTPSCTLTLPATTPSSSRSYRYQDWAVYLQDSWKVAPNFTFNYGVRYEYYGVQHNSNQQLDSNFYFGSGSNFYEQVRNGSVQIAPQSSVGGLWNPSYGAVAPRIGFAYDLFGDGTTSLRGGFGMSYERNFGNVTFNMFLNPPGYAVPQIVAGTPGEPTPVVTTNNFGPFGGSSGTVALSPASLRAVNQDIHIAQTQFYSLALERRLAQNTVFGLEYAGAHGVHLYDIAPANPLGGGQVYLGDSYDPALGDYSRPNNQYAGINLRGSDGTSRYNGLNVRFQTTNLHGTGLSLVANYTYSHSMDDLSSTFSTSAGGGSSGVGNLGYLDPSNPKLDWGSSDFDVRHRFVMSPIWETPWFKSGKGFLHQLLGGYTFSGIFTARTGVPFSIFDSTNSLNAGDAYGIPRYVPNGPITSSSTGASISGGPGTNNFIVLTLPAANTTAFNPALASAAFPSGISDFGPFPPGMTGRNVFRGPGAWNFDLAASKTFSLTERVKLELRAEGFDIFNHHNLYVNAFDLNVPNFGGGPITVTALKGGLGNLAIGGNYDERRFGQFSLRVSF